MIPPAVELVGPATGQTAKRQPILFWTVVGLLTALGVFVLPMAFPPAMVASSPSYMVGFNNRIAVMVVVIISVAVTTYLVRKNLGRRFPSSIDFERMPIRWLGIAAGVALAFTAVLGGFAARSGVNYRDIGYWQLQIGRWSHDHAVLYRDFEFCYGPVLFYWPAYVEKTLGHLGLRPVAGFIVALAIMQVVGIGILFYLLQQLPLSRQAKGLALAVLTFGTLTPLLGLNYTMFRFTIAYAALLWVPKQPMLWIQAALIALAEFLMLGISIEIGVSFAAGAMAYALYRGARSERRWLALLPVPVVAFGLFAALVDKGYFYTASNISKGLFNLIIEPFPYIHLFLLATVAICPFAVSGYIRSRGPQAAPIVGMYIASLAMASSALGRCDLLHVFFSSIGIALLSLIGMQRRDGPWSKIWASLLLLVPLTTQLGLTMILWPLLKSVVVQPFNTGGFDLARLESLTAGEKIYLPASAPQFVSDGLREDGQLQPSYFAYTTDAETLPGMDRKIQELNQTRYVLMPLGSMKWMTLRFQNNWKFRVFRLGYSYRQKHPRFDPGAFILADVQQLYVPVEVFGANGSDQYMLYRHK